MLEVNVRHHHMNLDMLELTTVVVVLPAAGIDAPIPYPLPIAFKMFQIVNGSIQKTLDTFKHFK